MFNAEWEAQSSSFQLSDNNKWVIMNRFWSVFSPDTGRLFQIFDPRKKQGLVDL